MEEKSPVLATFLSILFPGLGSVYAGKWAKGLSFMSIFVYTLYVLARGADAWLFLVVFWVFAPIEAYRDAAGGKRMEKSRLGWGIFWLILGAFLQLHVLGLLRLGPILKLWPSIFIVLGIYLIAKALKKEEEENEAN